MIHTYLHIRYYKDTKIIYICSTKIIHKTCENNFFISFNDILQEIIVPLTTLKIQAFGKALHYSRPFVRFPHCGLDPQSARYKAFHSLNSIFPAPKILAFGITLHYSRPLARGSKCISLI